MKTQTCQGLSPECKSWVSSGPFPVSYLSSLHEISESTST